MRASSESTNLLGTSEHVSWSSTKIPSMSELKIICATFSILIFSIIAGIKVSLYLVLPQPSSIFLRENIRLHNRYRIFLAEDSLLAFVRINQLKPPTWTTLHHIRAFHVRSLRPPFRQLHPLNLSSLRRFLLEQNLCLLLR